MGKLYSPEVGALLVATPQLYSTERVSWYSSYLSFNT
jgi:hypothetical protein